MGAEPRSAAGTSKVSTVLLRLDGIRKTYPGVIALDDVSFDLKAGEVHVLFGENGAGKSTLINVIAGVTRPDRGTIEVGGARVSAFDMDRARRAGIATVSQEFNLVPELTVADNIFLGREMTEHGWLSSSAMRKRAAALIDDLGFRISVDAVVGSLPRAQRQMAEIAKAMLQDASILVLDEPTASLGDPDADRLLKTVDMLRSRGVGIIYVSHRMREIRRIADRITVLRNGRTIGTRYISEVSESLLVEMMTGRRIDALFPAINHAPRAVRLDVRGLSTANGSVSDVSLRVHGGEIVGIAGLVGCGKSELGRALFGLDKIKSGTISLGDRPLRALSPRRMLRSGVCYFPSDRVGDGLALSRTVLENAGAATLDLASFVRFGILNGARQYNAIEASLRRLELRPFDLSTPVRNLSGGNKQKVLLARGLVRDIDVFIFDEPTVGIDVGSKTEIYNFLGELVGQGAAVLLISSELPEVLNLSNRVYVMHQGSIVSELAGEARTEANVLNGFFGHRYDGPMAVAQ
jgi:ribose transport system ATP-binding protein